MNPFVPFAFVAGSELFFGSLLPTWLGWPFLWAGGATGWVALAYLVNRPELLGKVHAPRVSFVALLPFFLFARAVAWGGTRVIRHPKVEVVPGLWVGGWPRKGVPDLAQLDLTAELPRRGKALEYACIPMLDGAPPNGEAWHAAVAQAVEWRRRGLPVLVHCAYGHGRSVAVVIGVLVAEGAASWEEAHARVLAVRPRGTMTAAQRAMVAAEARRLAG